MTPVLRRIHEVSETVGRAAAFPLQAVYPAERRRTGNHTTMRRITLTLFATTALALGCSSATDDNQSASAGTGGEAGTSGAAGAGGTPSGPPCDTTADCAETATPYCEPDSKVCIKPAGGLIGWGDGTPGSVTLTEIHRPLNAIEAPDLAFHPDRDELWVVNRKFEVEGQCLESNDTSPRCNSLAGRTTIIKAPGSKDQKVVSAQDQNAWHFMRRPPSLAMGDNGTFATCAEVMTSNYEDDPQNFTGATLWSTDLNVYAKPSGFNGSHLDMVHVTPLCMGIEHEKANVYWTFNGHVGSIDRYDFAMDHGPGHDDHSDGMVLRFAQGEFARVAGVPSHMVFNSADNHLYIADTGNARVAKLNTASGTKSGPIEPVYEDLAEARMVDNAEVATVVPSGTLEAPSGIALADNVVYVTDSATSRFYAFSLDGELLRTLETDLPPGSLAGVAVGSGGKLWFSDMKTGAVFRIDPS